MLLAYLKHVRYFIPTCISYPISAFLTQVPCLITKQGSSGWLSSMMVGMMVGVAAAGAGGFVGRHHTNMAGWLGMHFRLQVGTCYRMVRDLWDLILHSQIPQEKKQQEWELLTGVTFDLPFWLPHSLCSWEAGKEGCKW